MPAPYFPSPIHLILDLLYYPWRRNGIFDLSWKRIDPVNFLFMRFPSQVYLHFQGSLRKGTMLGLQILMFTAVRANKCNAMRGNGD